MGNILGKPQIIYITQRYNYYPDSSSQYYYGDEYEYGDAGDQEANGSYDWGCCPWCGLYPVGEEYEWPSWEGAVIGIVRRKGCKNRDHWALAFRSDIDVSQLPRRIKGYRTRISSRCKRTCSYWQPVYIFSEQESSDNSGPMEQTEPAVAAE